MSMTRQVFTVRSTATSALGASSVILLSFGELNRNSTVFLKRARIQHISGTATEFVPRLHAASTGTDNDVNEMWDGGTHVIADPYDTGDIDTPMVLSSDGQLALYIAPNAGSDNVFAYMFVFEMTNK